MRDLLNDRVLPDESVIPTRHLRRVVEQACFRGWIEVMVFSAECRDLEPRVRGDRLP